MAQFYKLKMQQLFEFTPSIFFACGVSQKTSLIAEYCRQNDYIHLKDPIPQTVSQLQPKNTIIEGSSQVFQACQKQYPNLQLICVGNPQNQIQQKLRGEYCSIGKCKRVQQITYKSFRKSMYPNLIFVYGPNKEQATAATKTLSSNINYTAIVLPKNVNTFISSYKKTCNYVIEGLFTDRKQLAILQQYFQLKVVHLQYNRIELPNQSEFFDKQFQILPYLKSKPYYIKVNGAESPVQVMDQIGIGLCPQLIFVNRSNAQHQKYLEEYIADSDGLLIGIYNIQNIRKRKNLQIANSNFGTGLRYTEVLFADLTRKQAILTDYPWNVSNEVIPFENLNRKISKFVDLTDCKHHEFCDEITSQMYFHEQQKRIVPNQLQKLRDQLAHKVQYWIINGPACAGKSTVAKYICFQFGYKIIEFQPYIANIKQKLMSPEDGEQLPVKKILAHFSALLRQDSNSVYLFDGVPYEGNDLKKWIQSVGSPNVINLAVDDLELIKRTRRKNQGDVNAQITEQDTGKAKQSVKKNHAWIQKLNQISPSSKIFQVNYNQPQILTEQSIKAFLRPRVYLIQSNNSVIFHNVAIRYDMAFINLMYTNLKQCLSAVKKANKRDVILCYYSQEGQRMVSEDLYWIQKNIGTIRYLCIFNNQLKDVNDPKLELQKPVVQEKRPVEAGNAEPPAQDPPRQEGGGQSVKKTGLNIHEFEWTAPKNHKNLSQWFCKLKSPIIEKKTSYSNCFDKFAENLNKINENSQVCIYEIVQ